MCDNIKTPTLICLLALLLPTEFSEDFPPQQEKGTATNPLESHLEWSNMFFLPISIPGAHPLPFVSKGTNLFKFPFFPFPQYQVELLQA